MDVTYLQSATSGTGAATYTFATQNIGTAATDRYIIIAAGSRKGGTTATAISSITVGGVTATEVIQVSATATNISVSGLYIVAYPTGTTADVVVNYTNAQARAGIFLYRATGINPAATYSTTSTANPPAATMTVLTNGAAIGLATHNSTSTSTWSGLTKTGDTTISGSGSMTTALATAQGQNAALSVSATVPGSERAGVFASFRPANQGMFFAF